MQSRDAGRFLGSMDEGARVWGVAFSPDGRLLAAARGRALFGDDDPGEPGTTQVWDPVTGEDLRTLTAHTGAVLGVAFGPRAPAGHRQR